MLVSVAIQGLGDVQAAETEKVTWLSEEIFLLLKTPESPDEQNQLSEIFLPR